MKLIDKIRLVLKGIPIVSEFQLPMTEESFKQFAKSKFTSEDDMNPFSLSSTRYLGHFYGYFGREFSVKIKSFLFRKDSISNSVWIHGKIAPLDEQNLILKITYYRTNFAKYGQWVLRGFLGLVFLIVSSRTLASSDFLNFPLLNGFLLLFYLIATLISISQTSGQIGYFKKHFIDEIGEKKTNYPIIQE